MPRKPSIDKDHEKYAEWAEENSKFLKWKVNEQNKHNAALSMASYRGLSLGIDEELPEN